MAVRPTPTLRSAAAATAAHAGLAADHGYMVPAAAAAKKQRRRECYPSWLPFLQDYSTSNSSFIAAIRVCSACGATLLALVLVS